MDCACINKIFDLAITAYGPTKMIIDDHSVWTNEQNFLRAYLSFEVSVDSLTKRGMVHAIPLLIGGRTTITAKELGYGDESSCIADDLYCFTVPKDGAGCGREISITRAYLPRANCVVDTLYADAQSEADYKQIDKIERLIRGVESQTELGRYEEAKQTHLILERELKDLICECCN